MDGFYEFVKKVIDGLTKEDLDYAFTGSLASSFYGVPRTTADIDVVVSVSLEDARTKLASALRFAGLKVEKKRIDDALTSGFKIATFKSGNSPYTVDVIFSDRVRKRRGNVAGMSTFFQVPEDLILAKLRMIKATVQKEKALKDVEDIRAILRFSAIDQRTVEIQARKDKTLAIWSNITETFSS